MSYHGHIPPEELKELEEHMKIPRLRPKSRPFMTFKMALITAAIHMLIATITLLIIYT